MKQSPPATDLSGPKASAVSLTPRRKSPAVAAAVDFQSDLFLSAVLGSLLSGGGSSWAGLAISGVATFAEEIIKGRKTGRVLFAHRRVSRHQRKGWRLLDESG